MKISLGSDHAGFRYKQELKQYLTDLHHDVHDVGTHSLDSVDYPDFAATVAREVASNDAEFGVLVCGSGIGVSITANKVSGVRAANCLTEEMASLARQHNNANVVTVGERLVSFDAAKAIVRTFLETPFEGGRHAGRVQKIHDLTGR
ncbi:MAG: ribose 5-phosphate isomerase B [Candidatus Kapaibacterium sp.]|nr:MAG: ribose 5-phosphate isomerase B [Candidatus Kapabacteria bacterium]